MSYSNKQITVISDFDGTITQKDVCYHLLEKYADFKWKEIDDKWIKGNISTEETYRSILSKLNIGQSDLNKVIDEVEIDKTFASFARRCKAEGIRIIVASDGLDYYIEKILKREGLEFIPVYANKLRFEEGKWVMSFPGTLNGKCRRRKNPCGCCKGDIVLEGKKEENKIVFIGDGASDRCAADNADYVFAKGFLKKYCEDNNVKHYPFETFSDVEKICVQKKFFKGGKK